VILEILRVVVTVVLEAVAVVLDQGRARIRGRRRSRVSAVVRQSRGALLHRRCAHLLMQNPIDHRPLCRL